MIIRTVTMEDLNDIVELESAAFKMTKQQTRNDMVGRIENYPDTFLVAQEDGKVIGHIFGPAFSKCYIEDEAIKQNRQAISLTCLPKLIKFYEKRGFHNEGETNDDIPDPTGVTSVNMVRTL